MYNYYVVKKGDTLYSIADMFNTSVQQLISLNNLSNNQILNIGDVLVVPISQSNMNNNYDILPNNDDGLFDNYIVKKGDRIFMGNNE